MPEEIYTYTEQPSHNDKKIIIDIFDYAINRNIKLYFLVNKEEYKNTLLPLFDAVTHQSNKNGHTIDLKCGSYNTKSDNILFFKTINASTMNEAEISFVKNRLYINSPNYGGMVYSRHKSIMIMFYSLPSVMSFVECKNITSLIIPESSGMWVFKNKDEFIDRYIHRAVDKHGSYIYLDTEESDTELRRLSEIFWFIDFLKGIYKYKDDLQEITDYVNTRQRNV